ncbi:MAG: hypothetical protein LWX07_00195 [Bacteroidetes bacterium]|nr:hypothetical protein [Bacteroidota bacterium]
MMTLFAILYKQLFRNIIYGKTRKPGFIKKYYFALFIFFTHSFCAFTQTLDINRANDFINAVINNNDDLWKFVSETDLEKSSILGIDYGVKHKFLIGRDIDENIKSEILKAGLKYDLKIENTDSDHSILEFTVPGKKYSQKYFFSNGYMISPESYYTRGWMRVESAHMVFLAGNPGLLNECAVNAMEDFLVRVCDLLEINKNILAENKIHYVLCSGMEEIEKITGYKSLGMCDLAFDYVISTFPCHYHELSHLLMNYKLHKIPLYTNPFLQEGFAVAMGGRGGREPYIIHDVGYFLARSGFYDYRELLNRQKFAGVDASISYPLCGLYNLFLIKTIGMEKYLDIYRKYSANLNDVNLSEIRAEDLPDENIWKKYLDSGYRSGAIVPAADDKPERQLVKTAYFILGDCDSSYKIGVRDTVFLTDKNPTPAYLCGRFKELFPSRVYNGEKYAIIAGENEILIYNLYTNNLIADYTPSLAIPPADILKVNGFCFFCIPKRIFDGELSGYKPVH